MAEPLYVDLVEEPMSGMLFPSKLQDSEEPVPKDLLGTALRMKQVMGMEVKVYAVAAYGTPSVLLAVKEGSSFTSALFTSPDEKVICLTFLQTFPHNLVVASFKETLGEFGVPTDSASAFIDCLPPSIGRGTEVRLRLRPQLNELALTRQGLADQVQFQGPELCHAFNEIYFGPRSIVAGLEESLQSRSARLLPAQTATGSTLDASGCINDDLSSTGELDSPLRGHGSFQSPPRGQGSFQSLADGPGSFRSQSGLPSIQSGSELASNAEAVPPLPGEKDVAETATLRDEDGVSPQRRRSWKDRAGREGGKDGYRFGDITRTVVHKTRERIGGGSRSSFTPPEESWPAAVVAEGDEEPWLAVDVVPHLDEEALAEQQLSAALYKHHTSPVRGNLIPQWSLRHFELRAGTLHYRRRKDGSVKGSLPLDGARVVVEPLKPCHLGDCFVFRVVADTGQTYRLSCSDKGVASSFALAIAAACAFFRARRFPGDRLPASEAQEARGEEAEAVPEEEMEAGPAGPAGPMAQTQLPACEAQEARREEAEALPDEEMEAGPAGPRAETQMPACEALEARGEEAEAVPEEEKEAGPAGPRAETQLPVCEALEARGEEAEAVPEEEKEAGPAGPRAETSAPAVSAAAASPAAASSALVALRPSPLLRQLLRPLLVAVLLLCLRSVVRGSTARLARRLSSSAR